MFQIQERKRLILFHKVCNRTPKMYPIQIS